MKDLFVTQGLKVELMDCFRWLETGSLPLRCVHDHWQWSCDDCRTLARELLRSGADVVFLCRRQPGDLIAILAQEFRVLILPELPLVACETGWSCFVCCLAGL